MRTILALVLVLVAGVAVAGTPQYECAQYKARAQASAARIPQSQAASTSHRTDAVNQGGLPAYIAKGDNLVAQGDAMQPGAAILMTQAAALEAQAAMATGFQAEQLWRQAGARYATAWLEYKRINQRYYQDAVHWYTCAVRPALATGP